MMTKTVSANTNHGVPMPRAIVSVKRPKRSFEAAFPRRAPKPGRTPFGASTSLRAARAMGCPPSAGERDRCCRGGYLFRFIVAGGTSPVIGQQIVEDIVNGHHPDEAVVLVHDGKRDQVVAGEDARHLGRARVGHHRLEARVE